MIIGNAFGAGEAFDVHQGGMGDWKSWVGGKAKSLGVSAAKGAGSAIVSKVRGGSKRPATVQPQQVQQVVSDGGSSAPAPAPSKIKPWMIGAGIAAVVGIGLAMRGRAK